MPPNKLNMLAASLLVAGLFPTSAAFGADKPTGSSQPSHVGTPSHATPHATPPRAASSHAAAHAVDRNAVDKILNAWPAGPQLAAQQMMASYGPPQEATPERLIWHEAGPFKRITLTRKELPHNFPIVHKDYLEHTISYNVPADKADEVYAFDASITVYRVGGELSARCDLESNNVITLNLANDIVTGKKSVEEARKEFGQIVMDRTLGKSPPYAMALQFTPPGPGTAGDTEKTTIPGAMQPAQAGAAAAGAAGAKAPGTAGAGKEAGDAEAMALLLTLDKNEVTAAMDAAKKKVSQPIHSYAKLLHEQHGKNIQDTLQLAQKIDVSPVETAAVDKLHAKGARALAKLLPLEGEAFGHAYVAQMIKGHEDALKMIDKELEAVQNEDLKKHLAKTREQLAAHLKEARKLQPDAKG